LHPPGAPWQNPHMADGGASAGDVVGWVVGAGGVITALAAAAVSVLNARHKSSEETKVREHKAAEETKVRESNEKDAMIDRLEKHQDRMQRQVDQLLGALDVTREAEAHCERRFERIYGYLRLNHDFACRLAALAKRLGQDPGEVPEMPPPDPPGDPQRDPGFVARTAQQDAALVRELGARVDPKGGAS
jgi:hypothetical protein